MTETKSTFPPPGLIDTLVCIKSARSLGLVTDATVRAAVTSLIDNIPTQNWREDDMNDPITTVSELIDFLSLLDGDTPVGMTSANRIFVDPLMVPSLLPVTMYSGSYGSNDKTPAEPFMALTARTGLVRPDAITTGETLALVFE